jgi:putative hydrolase of HD superfamily
MDAKKAVNFIFELNQLKRLKHNGFKLCGVKDPDSIAEHVMRAAQIGYILAVMEGSKNPEKVAVMVLIHDNGEIRIGDHHKVSARYLDTEVAEHRAFGDQLNQLGDEISGKWKKYFNEFEDRNTKEGIIAKDADWLETAFQAKEYYDQGYTEAIDWINNIETALETKSAKLLLKEIKKTRFTDWWKGFKKMTYKKIRQ